MMRVANLTSDVQYNVQQSEQTLAVALQQVSTGRTVNQPSDNPAASADLVTSLAASAGIDQYTTNITAATSQLQTADSALSSVISSLTSAVSLGTEGANGTSSSANKQSIASQVEGLLSDVVSSANTSYQGQYVFGGSASTTAPVLQAASSYQSQDAQVQPPLTAVLPLTPGSTVVVTNAATGQEFVYSVQAGETISSLTTAIGAAASNGTLPSGTSATINNGQLEISSGSSSAGIAVSSNDPVLGQQWAPVAGTAIANSYAYVGNSDVNSVQASSSLNVPGNIPGNQIFTGGANVVGALQGLISALQNGNATAIGTATQAVSTAIDAVSQARVPFENGISRLNSEESFLSQEKVTLSSQQTSLVGANLATAATNLSQAETQNSAVLAAAAKVLPQTLLNYLPPG